MERQVRDGNNLTYPGWILNNYFREYYSFSFGHAARYEIGFKMNDHADSVIVNGLTKDSINYYRKQHYPDKIFTKQSGDGIKLQFGTNNQYALLTIRDFHNEVLKDEYKQDFTKTIRDCFNKIIDSKTKNLVLDLRNNQGGDIGNGVALLSYLLDKPFAVLEGYACMSRKVGLKKCGGPALGMHQPKENRFRGNLYVLINGGSFSNSGIVSSCLKTNKRAIFIGEETGGNPFVINGDSKDITLPHTGIHVDIPTKQYIIRDKDSNNGRGIIPDHIINHDITDVLRDIDADLEYTIALINGK